MSNPATMALDWSNLLPEILQLIGNKITFLADFISFGAVCRRWQAAYSLLRGHRPFPLQLPWLMLPYQSDSNGNGDSPSTGHRLFYDLSTSKIHKFHLPQTCGVNVRICGSGHGWFVLQKGERGHEVSLLNPITRAAISLPKFRGEPSDLRIAPIDADEDFFLNFFDDNFCYIQPHHPVMISKAILTSSPRDPGCRVFVCTFSFWPLAFCNIGDEFWTVIEYHPEFGREIRWGRGEDIYDISYINGFLYAIDHLGTVTRYDVEDPDPTRTLLGGSIEGEEKRYLVQGESEDILLIKEIPTYVNGCWKETKHIVYKLSDDDENGEREWIQVTDVGQGVLFVGTDTPPDAFSLSSANPQLPEWGANCFYVWESEQKGRISWYNHNIKMERLDDGTVTDITGDLGLYELGRGLQSCIWLTPSLL